MSGDSQTLRIEAGLDLATARSAHAGLRDRLTALVPARPVLLELGEGRPTAPALQLVQATRLALRARGITPQLDPRAHAALGLPLNTANAPEGPD